MEHIFNAVGGFLFYFAGLFGISYNEINIIVYYFIVPFIYIALIDRLIRRHFLKAGFIILTVILLASIHDFSSFSNKLFDASVVFLRSFDPVGLNYIEASVVICVILPAIIFLSLLVLILNPRKQKSNNPS